MYVLVPFLEPELGLGLELVLMLVWRLALERGR